MGARSTDLNIATRHFFTYDTRLANYDIFWISFQQVTMEILSAAITLLFIMDPLGNIPIFQSMLANYTPKQRVKIMLRELIFAFIILVAFLFAGEGILGFLGLKQPSLSIAGGIVLFLIALRMVFPNQGLQTNTSYEDPFIVPLAVPLIAGPSAIAAILLLVNSNPNKKASWLLAITMAWLLSATILLTSNAILKFVGKKGLRAAEKLMGMLLIMIAVQMFLDGFQNYFTSL
jgi:multiple antibiotic resistance protein